MSQLPCIESNAQQITRLALTGAAFAGVGAVLNIYVPAFHRPTQWLCRELGRTTTSLSKMPLAKHIFSENPLTCHQGITEFLAINAMETPFLAVSMVSLGALMKASGIKPHHLKTCAVPPDSVGPHTF